MIEQLGTVFEVAQGQARVQITGDASCASCGAQGGCGTSALTHLFRRRRRALWLADEVGVQVGDQVVVGLDERALQRVSLIAYAWPLLGMLVGVIVGDLWAGSPANAELGAVVLGLSGLLVGVLFAQRKAERMSSHRRFQPRILRVEKVAVETTATLAPFPTRLPE